MTKLGITLFFSATEGSKEMPPVRKCISYVEGKTVFKIMFDNHLVLNKAQTKNARIFTANPEECTRVMC